MTRIPLLALAVVAWGCGKPDPGQREGTRPTGGSDTTAGSGTPAVVAPPATEPCSRLSFAESSSVPEASGAAWMTIGGKLSLVVISDSGNNGAYAIVDPETGATGETGKLALGNAGQDLEGVATRGGQLVGLTSSGWIRVWARTPDDKGFTLVEDAYPLGAVTLSDKGGMGDHPPDGDGMVCGAKATNCGRNYEGLCLVDPAHQGDSPCVGFAASKADGHLYCLTSEAGKLVVHHDRAIAVARPGAMADCAFADDGTLWAGSNLFDLAQVYRIDGWADPAKAKAVPFAAIGVGFPETLAVRGDVFYRMSDTGGSPSLMVKYRCKR